MLWFLGVIPMINLSHNLAIFCYMYSVPVRRGWYVGVSEVVGVSCGCLWLLLMLYITSFFVVCGCKRNHFCMHDVQVCVGVYVALSVSASCLSDL